MKKKEKKNRREEYEDTKKVTKKTQKEHKRKEQRREEGKEKEKKTGPRGKRQASHNNAIGERQGNTLGDREATGRRQGGKGEATERR